MGLHFVTSRGGPAFASVLLGCLIALCLPSASYAELTLCNDTPAAQTVAIGYKGEEGWTSQGWWTVSAGDCAEVVQGALGQRFYYLRVETPGWIFQDDKLPFCLAEDNFTIEGDNNCARRGFRQENFARIDTGIVAPKYRHNLSTNLRPDVAVSTQDQGASPEPQGTAVFQGCRIQAAPYVSFCTFIGERARFLVYQDSRTRPEIWELLQDLPQGRRFSLTGIREDVIDNTSDLVLTDFHLEEVNRADRLLDLLQGGWRSVSDPDDQFRIVGAERVNTYGGAETSVEYVTVTTTCEEDGGQGPYLYTWDNNAGSGLCYRIARVSDETLSLVYLPRGSELTYTRDTQ